MKIESKEKKGKRQHKNTRSFKIRLKKSFFFIIYTKMLYKRNHLYLNTLSDRKGNKQKIIMKKA